MMMSLPIADYRKLFEQLMKHEGTKRKGDKHIYYTCPAGKLTIGYGHNLDAKGLSERIAGMLLEEDIEDARADLYRALPWVESLDPVRQAVLINMVFNMGIGNTDSGLLSFRNTLTFIKEGKYVLASINMLKSKWAKQVGRRAVELAKMMETGVWV